MSRRKMKLTPAKRLAFVERYLRNEVGINKVKNIENVYQISADSRQNNFIVFHCSLDGEISKLLLVMLNSLNPVI